MYLKLACTNYHTRMMCQRKLLLKLIDEHADQCIVGPSVHWIQVLFSLHVTLIDVRYQVKLIGWGII